MNLEELEQIAVSEREAQEKAKHHVKVCVAAGGSLSGEHGIGVEKKEFMELVFNEADLDAMMSVKNVFNPRGLLNPSKIFPTRRSCTEIGKHSTTSTEEIGKRVEAILLPGAGTR